MAKECGMTTVLCILAGLVVLMVVGAASQWFAERRRRHGLPPRRRDQDRSKQKPDFGAGI